MTEQDDDGEATALNQDMVDGLVGRGVIRDAGVEAAFRSVPRHWFLPDTALGEVYSGRAIPTRWDAQGPVSSSSEPAIMAIMFDQLRVGPGQRVLEIGAGTGYNAALLARLVGPTGSVVTVDLDPDISAEARGHLATAGSENVEVVTADGWTFGDGAGPFDRIEATVGVWDLSPAWVDHLRPDGLLVVPLSLRGGLQASVAFTKRDDNLESTSVECCGFMRLRGPRAGPETFRQIGAWTVTMDEVDPATIDVLTDLLAGAPVTEPAQPLPSDWSTALAITEPDAVQLFSRADDRPIIRAGILDIPTRSLAVIDLNGHPGALRMVHSIGGAHARLRLLEAIERLAPLDFSRLTVGARPTAGAGATTGGIATLTRPEFTFLIDSAPGC